MSTIKVDTIATRTGSGNITASNALLAPSIGGSSDTNTSLSFPGSDVVQLNNGGTARYKFHNLNGTSLFEVQASSTGGSGAGGAFLKFKGSNGTPVDIASIDGSMTNGTSTSESGILSFFTMNSGTNSEKVRIFSNGAMAVPNGISLGNGISAAASNLLDDYEEGTWTPAWANGSGQSYTQQFGTYVKIGRQVMVTCFIMTSNMNGQTGDAAVGSLPFTASQGTFGTFPRAWGVVNGDNSWDTNLSTNNLVAQIAGGATTIRPRYNSGFNTSDVQLQQIGGGNSYFGATVVYETDS
tara:strand:+ start:312 stop:1199 length:888 start_codon:yes stop_codon:yes gene_type:complete